MSKGIATQSVQKGVVYETKEELDELQQKEDRDAKIKGECSSHTAHEVSKPLKENDIELDVRQDELSHCFIAYYVLCAQV